MTDGKTSHRVIIGNGDVVSFLEGMLDRARNGEIDAVCICMCKVNGNLGWGWSFKPDAPHTFARLLSAVTSAQHDMLMGGLHG